MIGWVIAGGLYLLGALATAAVISDRLDEAPWWRWWPVVFGWPGVWAWAVGVEAVRAARRRRKGR